MSNDRESEVVVPTRCPFCRSASICAAGRKVTASTYWRCEACSQLWHPERLQQQPDRSRLHERPYR